MSSRPILYVDTINVDLFLRDGEVLVNAHCDNDSDDDVANTIANRVFK